MSETINEVVDTPVNELTFGKYKGEKLEDILIKDAPYCKWLLSFYMITPEQKKYIEDNLPKDNNYLMKWGKYKGKKDPLWIYKHDYVYYQWLLNSEIVKKDKRLLTLLNRCPTGTLETEGIL